MNFSMKDGVERRRLLEAQVAASLFYRRELLEATDSWAASYLKRYGAAQVLAVGSTWKIGYDGSRRLVDHLCSRGFDDATLRTAGLSTIANEGHTIDRFRDQLMMLSWNEQLEPVGFVGLRVGANLYYTRTPDRHLHSRSDVLIGVAEQFDLITDGAIPVLVNEPMDALAIEKLGRSSFNRWAGISLCDSPLSTAQARILGRYASSDTAIVVLNDDEQMRRMAIGYLDDLSRFFRRVRAVELSAGDTPSKLVHSADGLQRLRVVLRATRPLADCCSGRTRGMQVAPEPTTARAPQDPGPGL